MKHRYTSLIAGSALILSMILAPSASFAASANQGQRGGIFANFASWFGAGVKTKVALADTTNRNLPPSISGITAPTVLTVDATGTWTVNASDPENGSLSYSVDWGDQMLKSLFSLGAQSFVQESSFTHAYTSPGTYTVKFTVKDEAGLSSSSSATVHVIASDQPPVIAVSDVNATAVNQNHASISWATNVRGDSTVFYSLSADVNPSSAFSETERARVLKHKINLNRLSPGTTYYFYVQSKDAAGNIAKSNISSFATPAAPSSAPSISKVEGPVTLTVNTEGTWTVNASDPENGSLSYSVDWGDSGAARMMALAQSEPFTQVSTFTHTYAAAGTYTITFTVKDDTGLTATAKTSVVVNPEAQAAPVLSGITALVGSEHITLNWSTDVAANSEVYYSASSPVVIGGVNTTALSDGTLSTNHSLTANNLAAGTTYYFIIKSKNADGNATATSQFSLTTLNM